MYLNGVPYDAIADLRRSSPVYWNPEENGGFWSILTHSDIVAISKNPHLFSSANRHGGHRIFDEQEVGVAQTESSEIGVPFISTDPPLHRSYRGLVQPALSIIRVRDMREKIGIRAKQLLNSVPEVRKEFDFVSLISSPFPLIILADLFGVPKEDAGRLLTWSNAMIGEDDPSVRVSPQESTKNLEEMLDYAGWIFEDRKKNPKDDVLSMLANGLIDGSPISKSNFLASFILLLVGGNETTRNSMNHGMIAFTHYREQWEKLKLNKSLLSGAVKEVIRWSSPVLHMRRTAVCDTTIHGQKIRSGEKIVLWYMSANRDETVYEKPNQFDIERDSSRHLAFGAGNHICVGNRLAEAQLEIIFEELINRFPDIRVVGGGRRLRSNFINGFLELPVKLH